MSRSYINTARLAKLAQEISPKELAVVRSLYQLRIASSGQLQRLHFHEDGLRNRRRVLQGLSERGLVTQLDRVVGGRRPGSSELLYSSSAAGVRLLGRAHGSRLRPLTAPGAPFVAHALAVTELIVRLREAERRGGFDILEVQTEPQCWRHHPGPGGGTTICKPDAYIRLGVGEFEESVFCEMDRSTESPLTLTRQMDAYRRYWASGVEQSRRNVFPRVLWIVPDLRRHEVVVDLCSRQPADAWQLHLVTTFDDAVGLMTGETS